MPITIRPLEKRDYERVVEIENSFAVQPFSVEEMIYFLDTWPADSPVLRLVAELDGRVVGGAEASYKVPWAPEGDANLGVSVDRTLHGQGVGRALWAALQPFLQEHRPLRLRTRVRDDAPAALAWAERRGFARHHHIFNSEMDLARFDETPFAGVVEAAEARGLRWVHFDQIRTPETEQQLWAFEVELQQDVPDAADRAPAPFEEWRKWALEGPESWPAGTILAVAPDGQWAAMTSLHTSKETGKVGVGLTGVRRSFRGAQLALAIKLAAIRWLKVQGIAAVVTNNHSANQPMLAVNRKLGYVPLSGHYLLRSPGPGQVPHP